MVLTAYEGIDSSDQLMRVCHIIPSTQKKPKSNGSKFLKSVKDMNAMECAPLCAHAHLLALHFLHKISNHCRLGVEQRIPFALNDILHSPLNQPLSIHTLSTQMQS